MNQPKTLEKFETFERLRSAWVAQNLVVAGSRNPAALALAKALVTWANRPDLTTAAARWHLTNGVWPPPGCEICGAPTPFRGAALGYQRTCSIQCSRHLPGFQLSLRDPAAISKRQAGARRRLAELGLTNFSQLEAVKDKIRKTNLRRRGVASPLSSPEVRAKIAATNLKRYGAENVLSANSAARAKLVKTNLARYGVENVFAAGDVKAKIAATNQARYGVENVLQAGSPILEKVKVANRARHGVENVLQAGSPILAKVKATNRGRYGVENVLQAGSPVLARVKDTNLANHGVENVFSARAVRAKIAATNVGRYGHEVASKSADVGAKISAGKIKTYAATVLQERLAALAEIDIVPSGWDAATYAGGPVKLRHATCGTTFETKFYGGGTRAFPKCSQNRSVGELMVAAWLERAGLNPTLNDRTRIPPLELDLIVGDVAIEVNGVYYHSDDKQRTALAKKTELAAAAGLRLLHFWDVEISKRPAAVRSALLAALGHFERRLGARQLELIELSAPAARAFLERAHLQGFCGAKHHLGLRSQAGELLMVASFGPARWDKAGGSELIRLASAPGVQVVGGASRLIAKFFELTGATELLSYSDNRFSAGNLYRRLGFSELGKTKPNYFWFKNGTCLPRYATQKHRLPLLLGEQFDATLGEEANMRQAGWLKCSDCGNTRWRLRAT